MKNASGREIEIGRVVVPANPTRTVREGGVITPVTKCTVITTSGQMWDIEVLSFHAVEEIVRKAWELTPDEFTKREQA